MARYGVVMYDGTAHYYEPVSVGYRVTKVGFGQVRPSDALLQLIAADQQKAELKAKGWAQARPTFAEITGERLARLNPPSIWPDTIGTGRPETEPAELAQALGRVRDNVGYELVTAKYVRVGCERAQALAFYRAYDYVIDMAINDKWDDGPKGKHWFRNLTTLAIMELTENMLCSYCNGTGTHAANGKNCALCGGTGKMVMSDVVRAEAVEIPYPDWKNKWRDRYEKVYRRLQAIEGLALSLIGRQLWREPS